MYFTFDISNDGVPSATINGKKIALVSCNYEWLTANDRHIEKSIVTIGGYIVGDIKFRVFQLNLKTKKAIVCL